MLNRDDAWLMDLSDGEPADAFQTMPELRQWLGPRRPDDELGLRALLERPDVQARSWRRTARADRGPANRHADLSHAA